MTESRDENGNFAEGHTDGPEIGTGGQADPERFAWHRTRVRIKREYPKTWDKYAIESEDDE